MRLDDPDDTTEQDYVAPNNKDGSGQPETDQMSIDEIVSLIIEYQKNQSRINKKPELTPVQARQLIERYSHHQTEQAREDEAYKAYLLIANADPGKTLATTLMAQEQRLIELRERIKEQSLPTNNNKGEPNV